MRTTIFGAVLVIAALSAPPAANADDKKKAKALYDEGLKRYNLAEYPDAIKAWKEAYLLSKKPLLLFNIGQAYRLSGDCKQALTFYDSYQREEPSPKNQDELDQALALCKDVKPADKPAAASDKPAVTTKPVATDKPAVTTKPVATDKPAVTTKPVATDKPAVTTKPVATDKPAVTTKPPVATDKPPVASDRPVTSPANDKLVTTVAPPDQPDEPSDEPTTSGGGLRKIGIGVGIAGVVLGGVGVYFALDSGKASSDLDGFTGPWGQEQIDLEARGERSATLGLVFGISGAAALVAGGVMFAIGGPKAVESSSMSVIPTNGGGQLTWSHRF